MNTQKIEIEDGFYVPLYVTFVIDPNGMPELRLVFTYDFCDKQMIADGAKVLSGTYPNGSSWTVKDYHGIIVYGTVDESGKWWSSRPSCFMDIKRFVGAGIYGRNYAGAVSEEYYAWLKMRFNLPFDLIEVPWLGERRLIFVDPNVQEYVGKHFYCGTRKVTVKKVYLDEYNDTVFLCDTKEGTRYFRYRNVPSSWTHCESHDVFRDTVERIHNA